MKREVGKWSWLLSQKITPLLLVRHDYKMIQEMPESPVGEVDKGCAVLIEYRGKRAVWIDGKVYQK